MIKNVSVSFKNVICFHLYTVRFYILATRYKFQRKFLTHCARNINKVINWIRSKLKNINIPYINSNLPVYSYFINS